jgi:hypothetical protein
MDGETAAGVFTADTRFDPTGEPFCEARLVAIVLDVVAIWGRELLPISMARPLLCGVEPSWFRSAAISREQCKRLRYVRRW